MSDELSPEEYYALDGEQFAADAEPVETIPTVFQRDQLVRFRHGPLNVKRPDGQGYDETVTVVPEDDGVYLGPGHDELGAGADDGWHRCTVERDGVTYIVPVNDGRNDPLLRQFEARE